MRRRAHPRECGADADSARARFFSRGSSPRVRGRPRLCRKNKRRTGLIPASAGQTRAGRSDYNEATAHPRECGADLVRDAVGYRPGGSSPRVRGRPPRNENRKSALGAHPRECGADLNLEMPRIAGTGSSPRVRGRPAVHRLQERRRGLIPASAGQTCGVGARRVCGGAHPRECGADSYRLPFGVKPSGSSPRVRGRLWSNPPGGGGRGSSPRVRGRPTLDNGATSQIGLIPASAGQTLRDQQRCTNRKG